MLLIPTIYQVDDACANKSLCVIINISLQDIYLTRDEILAFLIKTNIKHTELAPVTMYGTLFYDEDYCSEIMSERWHIPFGKDFIPSLADIDIHRKVKLKDAEIAEQHKQ